MREIFLFVSSLSVGGAERVVSNLSLNFHENVNGKIILLKDIVDYPYKGDLIVLKKTSKKNIISRVYGFILRYHQLKTIKRKHPNATFISFLSFPNLLNILTRRHARTIISVRNHMSSQFNRGFKALIWNFIIKNFYKKADKIIAVSEEVKYDLIVNYKLPKNKIKVIYNSYSISEIQKLSKEKLDEKYRDIFDNPVIITAGRLNLQKGHWHLIRVFKKIKEKINNAKLVILGVGDLQEDLIALCKELGVSQDVIFIGFSKNPFKYISRSKLFVLPSYYEGFPNALAEAMACGVPVISTDCSSGPREILAPLEKKPKIIDYKISKSRYGILNPEWKSKNFGAEFVYSHEEKQMINSIVTLLENKSLREFFSKKSLERIKDFENTKITKCWKDL